MVGRAAYNKYVKIYPDWSVVYTKASFFLDSLSILDSPWQTLGHVDTAVYGVPSSGLTRRQVTLKYSACELLCLPNLSDLLIKREFLYVGVGQVLEQYQEYGDSVLGTHGNGRPNVRDLVKVESGRC